MKRQKNVGKTSVQQIEEKGHEGMKSSVDVDQCNRPVFPGPVQVPAHQEESLTAPTVTQNK